MSTLALSNTENRGDLYYGQYLYQARFYLPEASCLRDLNHKTIEQTITWRIRWDKRFEDLKIQTQNLHIVCDQLLALKNPYKKVIYQNWVYIYTSEFNDIVSLSAGPMVLRGTTQVNVVHPKDTIALKNPKHKFRTFIRSHKPTDGQVESLRVFVEAAGDDIRPSPSLNYFLTKRRYTWMQEHYFVDHNDMSMVTALALINPRLIRKTMPIVQVNN